MNDFSKGVKIAIEKIKIGKDISINDTGTLEIFNWEKNKTYKNIIETLPEKGRVFITPLCSLPKRKFKLQYPQFEVVNDPDLADFLIIKYNCDIDLWIRYWKRINIFGKSTKELWNPTKNDIFYKRYLANVKLLENIGKPAILETNIYHKGQIPKEMSDEEFEKIKILVSGSDSEMVKLGQTMMFGFDEKINKIKMLQLYLSAETYYFRKTKEYISYKAKLRKEYKNIR